MKKILRWISFALGFAAGMQTFVVLTGAAPSPPVFFGVEISGLARYAFGGLCGLLSGFIVFFLFPLLARIISSVSNDLVKRLRVMPLAQIGFTVAGLTVGLVLAALISSPILRLDINAWISGALVFIIYAALSYLGVLLCSQKYPDIEQLLKNRQSRSRDREEEAAPASKSRPSRRHSSSPKILDTSVIIDGRIFDILKTGFMEGPVVIANFVLDELQLIADSPDSLKRNRGRRGLDVLNRIQKELHVEVVITDKNYPGISEVDTKLLKLTMDMKGKIVTNDYNLNKIAELQGIEVLNTNDLSNAVKSVVLPGEEMSVQVVKEGKEHNQGVAYLDDGTMIVVEDGRALMHRNVQVVVTSVLQTSAGRMIFARPVTVHA